MELNKEFLEKYNDLMNEDVELALDFSLNALKESNNSDFYAYIADCYMSLDEFDKAVNILEKSLSNNCTNSTYAKSLLGESLFYLNKFEESKSIFENLKLENPNSFFVTAYLIDININLNKYSEAIKLGENILNSNVLNSNDTAYILVNLGWINLKYLNNNDEALKYFNKAIEIDENIGRAYIGLAEYYFNIGEYTNALINYEKAIDLQEGTIDVYFGIAMCYKALKQYEDALSYLNIVHDADSTNETYINEIKEIEKL
ncbi:MULTISPECIES: lipopolysaccharide assembly protein LapB [unclassified Clostridium]|uniref:tetratricopeptide repeat protein n=1 Tax=unclassified Clostridium TaxID=2614128 RepID=UPI001C8B8D69|nr:MULTISPECIES: tetratricopeptide repeat protein [unclassified Clostridium]MBX9136176.1 tetratricopeptide repeat protein [Clostridium sp. K12(2020)]MBX9143192.1 tetratricopeptide repeat protein [Clostridium sp. K13]